MKKKAVISSVLIISVCVAVASFLLIQQQNKMGDQSMVYPAKVHTIREQETINRNITEKITIGAIGDILIHDTVYKDAFSGSQYNFNPIFEKVKSILETPDILTANQESMLGGVEIGVSSYPMFNSPHEVADALVNTGVDIVSLANNHTLDKGERGILSATDYLNSIGLPHVGSFLNEEDRKKLRILKKNGINLAFLSYTYGTNGIPIPNGKDFLVNLINRDQMKEEIHRAKQEADVVVMSIHWGNEYQRIPTSEQKELANFLANEGVDIIFGSHPHVLQPMEWIETADGRKSFVIYSLGNFISGQIWDYKDIGGMATVEITKQITESGKKIELSNPIFYPTFVSSKNFRNYQVVPLDQAGSHGLDNAAAKNQEILEHMNQWLR
ncbi:CapA family protein [Bacillus sp. MRMR6]|uniref:CapA family protein n=1 Tax=Bacillus sp. MRMR6 TaxID=1928617 RepID=UPI0009521A73|nr:CapA family protein [Bacillus sp. MRMR6]OLS38569.1 capsular biosynthesis protein [Bacillus sp. MRMR6]